MLKASVAAAALLLAAAPAGAATFTYVGAPFAGAAGTGFKRVSLTFVAPGVLAPNTSYTLSSLTGFNDGLNKLPAITGYLAKGKAFGGVLDSFLYGTVTTGPTGKPLTWLIKMSVFYIDGLGNEGYSLIVSGPGNSAAEPGVFDTIYTTLPETLPSIVSLASTRYGTMTAK